MASEESESGTLQDVADSILWAPDRPAVERLWEYADEDADDPDMDAHEWVRALRYVSQYGVCLDLGRGKYLNCSKRRIYELYGQPYPSDVLTVSSEVAVEVVKEHMPVEPVLIGGTGYYDD